MRAYGYVATYWSQTKSSGGEQPDENRIHGQANSRPARSVLDTFSRARAFAFWIWRKFCLFFEQLFSQTTPPDYFYYPVPYSIAMKFLSLVVAASMIRPVIAGFGRTPEAALKPTTSSGKRHRRHWSSTGMDGLDHSQKTAAVSKVKVSSRPKKEEDHHLEHHPFASGVFTIDPHHA